MKGVAEVSGAGLCLGRRPALRRLCNRTSIEALQSDGEASNSIGRLGRRQATCHNSRAAIHLWPAFSSPAMN